MSEDIPLPPPLPSAPLIRNKKKPMHENFRAPYSRRRIMLNSLMCGLSPLVKNRKGSELEAESDHKPGRKRVRFESRVVYHQIPFTDPDTKHILYYSQKEIEGFFTLKKMEQMIHMYTLTRKRTACLQAPIQVESERKKAPINVIPHDPLLLIQEEDTTLVDPFSQKNLPRMSEVKV
jgi:hypothetical protein